MLRTLLLICVMASPVLGATATFPPSPPLSANALSPAFPPMRPLAPLDFKKEVPFKTQHQPQTQFTPELTPLIDELVRHTNLQQQFQMIMPFVYAHGMPVEVEDFEEAVLNLEIAEQLLLEAMQGMLNSNTDSIRVDPLIHTAKTALDDSEFILFYLKFVSHYQA
ncbi:MAG: hypothetical protein AB8B55_07065 [Mariniblastus sp.]